MTVAELSVVVAGHAEGSGEETHVVPPEVFEKVGGHLDLAHGLGVGFGYRFLNGLGEELRYVGIAQCLSCLFYCYKLNMI